MGLHGLRGPHRGCLLPCAAGWSDLRLLAPRAELRLLLAGTPHLIDGNRLVRRPNCALYFTFHRSLLKY